MDLLPPTSEDRTMYDLWESVYYFPAVTVADEIGLSSLLAQAAISAVDVADGLGLNLTPTVALLGVTAGLGFLVKNNGLFHLTPNAREFLLPDSPYYWGGVLHPSRTDKLHQYILKALRKSDTDVKRMTGDWSSGQISPALAERITTLMHSHSFASAMGMAGHCRFDGVSRLLDVGGGSGCYCIALASRFPEVRFAVLELPVVCDFTQGYIARYGMEDRIDTIALDMFRDRWPEDYDAHLFSEVFHDWSDARCLELAKRSFEALPPGGRIYLHEILITESMDGPLTPMTYFLGLTTLTEGRQFTAQQLADLLTEAGFIDVTSTPSAGYYSLTTGFKPSNRV
jgi:cyclopropane fatty-acyl-phospholipid synthase-like methyltransferase